jgi:hypothetical protein
VRYRHKWENDIKTNLTKIIGSGQGPVAGSCDGGSGFIFNETMINS